MIYWFAGFVWIAAVLALLAGRRHVLAAVVLLSASLPLSYGSLADLMGRPKPLFLELRNLNDPVIIAYRLDEGKAIYLWVDGERPTAYALPWNLDHAKQLQGAARRANDTGGRVRMRMPFENDQDTEETMFYAEPQPAPPPKREVP